MPSAALLAPDRLSELIGAIYDCALDPGQWPQTLARIRKALGFEQATLNLQGMPGGAVLLNVASGIPTPWRERIADYGPQVIALWGGAARIVTMPLEEPVRLSDVNSDIATAACDNSFHLEWHRPQGLIDAVAIGLTRDATSLSTASFARHERDGAIGRRETDAIRLLAPHLRRAVTISRLLDIRTIEATTFETVIDAMETPIFVTDGEVHVLHANAAARLLLKARDPLMLDGRRLATNASAATQALSIAVQKAAGGDADLGRRGLGVPVVGADGFARALHVLPLRRGEVRSGLVRDAVAAIFVSSGAPTFPGAGVMVAQLFGLTGAEARVFELVAGGVAPNEAAEQLGIASSTVRTHLLRIFDKTGVRRQADLIRMAASLSPPS